MPTCGSMTATPEGAAYLLEGVIRSPFFPPLRRTFQVKTLTFWSGNGGARGVTSSLEATDIVIISCQARLSPKILPHPCRVEGYRGGGN